MLGGGAGATGPYPIVHGMTVWPSGLRRWLQAPVRKGVGSNPTAVTFAGQPEMRKGSATQPSIS